MEKIITNEIVEVTPAMAKEWLDKYFVANNRVKKTKGEEIDGSKDRNVLYYADQMKRGKWELDGETIKFATDENGNQIGIDGRHRLTACYLSGMTIAFEVRRGLKPNHMLLQDQGKGRTGQDTLVMQGMVKDVHNVAAAIKKLYALTKGQQATGRTSGNKELRLSNGDIWDMYCENSELWDSLVLYAGACYRNARHLSRADIMAYMAFLITVKGYDREYVEKFFDMLFMHRTYETTPCIAMFQKKCNKDLIARTKMKSSYKESLLILAWNDYVEGKNSGVLRLTTKDKPVFMDPIA